ncbi:phosphatase PAP2 family protein [Streptomyces meridianus]|uniref:Phosphatase PAP2 family protein n=1 Tax=Streptomyces meridianus TaxID=2938945 RepID=A0ABT0X9D3_9ACTN|nr:phosphatase PAP2 family protein [Streptomyces meridianus]MCM2578895.1 phosphatase PAP2 family protein [Streptomyces meridianus]
MLFALLSWQVAVSGPLLTADEHAGRAAVGSDVPRAVAEFAADLGSPLVAVPPAAVVVLVCVLRDRRSGVPSWWLPLAVTVLATAAVPALVVPLKILVARPGPDGPLGGYPGFYPSGHAATAAVAYGLAALVLLRRTERTAARRLAVAVAGAGVAAVGAGVVLRGYHWPLDVLGSWCLAGLLLGCADRALRIRAAGP